VTASAATLRWAPRTRPFRLGLADVDDDEELPAGAVVAGRFRIVRPLGMGGMGRVYEVEHVQLPRRLALKLLRRDKHSAEHLARFRQEAEAASRVGHPAIVDIVDFGMGDDGRVYLAMELLRGESLEHWLGGQGRLVDGLRWLAEIARGLDAAHRTGVVHRDVKPQNLFLHRAADGRVLPKILDFGIAKVTSTDHTAIATAAGTVLGTPYYLAPERALGRPLDARADLYSVGVVLYEMLTGNVPFADESFMGVLMKHVREPPLDPRQAAPERPIPDGVATLTMALWAKDPAERPASGLDVAERLESMVEHEFAALAAVPTGPREPIAATDDATMSLDAIASRPTTAPTEDAPRATDAVREPERPTVPAAADRSMAAAAVRTRFETSSPSLPAASLSQAAPRAGSPVRAIAIAGVLIAAAGVAGMIAMKPRTSAPSERAAEPAAPAKVPSPSVVEAAPKSAGPPAVSPSEPPAAVGAPAPTPTVAAPAAAPEPTPSKPRTKKPATKSPTPTKPKESGVPAFKEDMWDD
jgi:serine/threonine-protein kinase